MYNYDLLCLTNDDNFIYETPVIGYYHINNNLPLLSDIYREYNIKELGKSYYFLIDMPSNADNNDKLYIVRVAIFLGQVCVTNNYNWKKYNSFYTFKNTFITTNNYYQHTVLSYK